MNRTHVYNVLFSFQSVTFMLRTESHVIITRSLTPWKSQCPSRLWWTPLTPLHWIPFQSSPSGRKRINSTSIFPFIHIRLYCRIFEHTIRLLGPIYITSMNITDLFISASIHLLISSQYPSTNIYWVPTKSCSLDKELKRLIWKKKSLKWLS